MEKLQSVGMEISYTRDGPTVILNGADTAGKLMTRNRELQYGSVALETLLGWTLTGKVEERQ